MGVDLSRLPADPRPAHADRRGRDRDRRHARWRRSAPARRAATVPPIAALTGGAELGGVGVPQADRRRCRRCSAPVWPPALAGLAGSARRRHGRRAGARCDRASSSASPCSARSRFGVVTACVRMADAHRRRRRRLAQQERRPQPAPHGDDRGGADDRPDAGVDRARGRRLGQGDDRLHVRAVGQGRLLRHRRARGGRVPGHAGRRAPRSPTSSPRRPGSPTSTHASTARSPTSSASTSTRSTPCSTSTSRQAASTPPSPTRWSCRSTRRRRSAPASATRSPSRSPTARASRRRSSDCSTTRRSSTEDYLFDTSVLAAAGVDADRRVAGRLDRRRRLAGRRGRRASPASSDEYPYAIDRDRRRVPSAGRGHGRRDPDDGQRDGRAGRGHRPDRHRQHAGAVGVRAHP